MQPFESNVGAILDTTLSKRIDRASSIIPRHWQWRILTLVLVITDILMTGLAFRLAYLLRFDTGWMIFVQDAIPDFTFYQNLVFLLLILWIIIFAVSGLYNRQNLLGGTREYEKVFRSTLVGFLFVILIGFLVPEFIIARGWLFMAWAMSFFLAMLGRFIIRRLVYLLRRKGFYLTPAIIIGGNQEGRWLAQQLLGWSTSGLYVVGFVDKKVPVGTPLYSGLCSLGRVEDLDELIDKYEVGELILASSAFSSRDHLLDIFKKYGVSKDVNVHMSSGLYEIITTGLTINEFAYVPLVYVNKVRLTGVDYAIKSIMDYVIAIPLLILLSPLLLAIVIAIRLDSPGKAIYRRAVMGLNGRQFDAFKFRTMYINGDEILVNYPDLKEELARNHKLKKDPRVTRVGAFIRKYSLDELPQLFNVLLRDMSLVGPRMISPEEVAMYKQFNINLLTVRPGITGLWQVSGRSDISYDERVQLDMYYVRNWSIWFDIQLLIQTIPAALKGRGAY